MSPRFLQCFAPLERSLLHILHPILPQELQVQPLLVGVELLVLILGHNDILIATAVHSPIHGGSPSWKVVHWDIFSEEI